ncbi:MAG: MFS transporter [Ornithinimicrobium sp.]
MSTPTVVRPGLKGRALTAAPWIGVVAAGGILSAMTAPGQTAGLSVFTDPLISELGLSRTEISVSYLLGTLVGAGALPFVGRALDRWSVRVVTAVIGIVFATFLLVLSVAGSVFGLTAGFIGVRMAGQGALSLAATTVVARTVVRRRGLALGIATAVGSGGISLAPVLLASVIPEVGIQQAWRFEAVAVLCVVTPIALLLPRTPHRAPADALATRTAVGAAPDLDSWTLDEALRTGRFWIIAAALAATGLLSTALAFHQISILGAEGLSPLEAAANFLPQTLTGIAATLAAGALSDRIAPKYCVTFSMVAMAAALLLIPTISPGWTAIVYGLVLGAAGGSIRGIEAAAFARYFGTLHIGSIRGVATAINLASTAAGPLVLSLGRDLSGGYHLPVILLALIPLSVGALSVVARPPSRRLPHGLRTDLDDSQVGDSPPEPSPPRSGRPLT